MTDWVNDFNARLEALPPETEEEKEWHRLEWRGAADDAALRALESALGFALPPALHDLHLTHGPFQSEHFADAWETVLLRNCDEMAEARGLPAFIDFQWGGRPELAEGLTAAERAHLNAATVVFGLRHINDNEHEYFFFHSDGRIGTVMLDQDSMDWALEQLHGIAKGEFADETLAALFSRQFDAMIEGFKDLV